MLRHFRQLHHKKWPMLLLALLLCVQSFGGIAHSVLMADMQQMHTAETADSRSETEMPPCHLQAAAENPPAQPYLSDCCLDGNCSSGECLMPAATTFEIKMSNYYIAHVNSISMFAVNSVATLHASPPIRPPIA